MRLTTEEKQGILDALHSFKQHIEEARLFGSRIDDSKRGGDIDLLIIAKVNNSETLKYKKFDILAEIKKNIGDQKIDLKIVDKKEIAADYFLQNIYTNSLVLD